MSKVANFALLGILGLSATQADAITLQLDYSYDSNNFFDTALKRTVMNSAASYFGSRINDSLGAIQSAGGDSFTAGFFDPGTGLLTRLNGYNVAADTLVVFVGGRELGGNTLGLGGPGSSGPFGTLAYRDAAFSRGQGDGTQASVSGSSAYDFAPWGGSVSFDSSSAWYFDSDVNTTENIGSQIDFYSVALHELGHVLGFGTADSWNNLVSGTVFTGDSARSAFGGDVPLADGAHWKDGTPGLVDGLLSQETAMDPTIRIGARKVFTDLDLAALQDIGWQVVGPVPVPAAVYLFASAVIGLLGLRRTQAG